MGNQTFTEVKRNAALLNIAKATAAIRAKSDALPKWKCATCGVEAPATVHQLRKTYCSKKCMSDGYKFRLKGTANPNYKNAGYKVCEECSREYPHYSKVRKFCSIKCRDKSLFYMRGRAKKDGNHNEIVAALEMAGCSVLDISMLGQGKPDIIVGHANENFLVEIKNPNTAYGKKGFSKLQVAFADIWPGKVYLIRTVDEALIMVGLKKP